MPELPEVETIVRHLRTLIIGKQIARVSYDWPRMITSPAPKTFQKQLIGQRIESIQRRGKFLIFTFHRAAREQPLHLVIHLRMSGQLLFHDSSSDPREPFVHCTFHFTDGTELRFNDARKFGRLWLIHDDVFNQSPLKQLGPEPIGISVEDFIRCINQHRGRMKSLLLQQTCLAGIGNIYADESLFSARIHPETLVTDVSMKKLRDLYQAIQDILTDAIKHRGTSDRTFLTPLGQKGSYKGFLKVYGRQGQPCVRCGTKIMYMKVGQRGTHICPHCQKKTGKLG